MLKGIKHEQIISTVQHSMTPRMLQKMATHISMTTATILTGAMVPNNTETMETGTGPTPRKPFNLLRDSNFWIWFPSYFTPIAVFLCIACLAICVQKNCHAATTETDDLSQKQGDDDDDDDDVMIDAPQSGTCDSNDVRNDDVFYENGDNAQLWRKMRNQGVSRPEMSSGDRHRPKSSSLGNYHPELGSLSCSRHDSAVNTYRHQSSHSTVTSSVAVDVFPCPLPTHAIDQMVDRSRDMSQEDEHNSWIAASR